MEKAKAPRTDELNDDRLENVSGGASKVVRLEGVVCRNCGGTEILYSGKQSTTGRMRVHCSSCGKDFVINMIE